MKNEIFIIYMISLITLLFNNHLLSFPDNTETKFGLIIKSQKWQNAAYIFDLWALIR